MNDWLIETWRGAGGLQRDPELSTGAAIPVGLKDLFARLGNIYGQLNSTIDPEGDSEGFRIVTFEFSRSQSQWIVVVQGSGGPYGSAGALQLLAAPVGTPASQVIPTVFAAQTDDPYLSIELLDSAVAPVPHGDWFAAQLEPVLQRLVRLRGSTTILDLIGEPAAVESQLQLLSQLLPEGVARGFFFSTAYAPSDLRTGCTITGGWPEVLRLRHPERFGRVWLPKSIETAPLPPTPPGIEWVVAQAEVGRYPGRDSAAATMQEWLAELETQRPWTAAEARARLMQGLSPDDLSHWTQQRPAHLVLGSYPELLDSLLDNSHPAVVSDAVDLVRRDLKRWQPQFVEVAKARARAGADWHLVGDALGRDDSIRVARTALLGAAESTLRSAAPWLKSLQITRDDLPELFPTDADSLYRDLLSKRLQMDQVVAAAFRTNGSSQTLAALADKLEAEILGELIAEVSQAWPHPVDVRPMLPEARAAKELDRVILGIQQWSCTAAPSAASLAKVAKELAKAADVDLSVPHQPGPRTLLLMLAADLPVPPRTDPGKIRWWRAPATWYWAAILVLSAAIFVLGVLVGRVT